MKVEDFLKQNKIEQKIDAVYPIKKIRIDEDSVLLYLEDEKIRISDEAYFSYGIKNLKGLDEELYQKLKDDETLFKAYKSCLRKLSMKDHTVKQIRDFLSLKQLKRKIVHPSLRSWKAMVYWMMRSTVSPRSTIMPILRFLQRRSARNCFRQESVNS